MKNIKYYILAYSMLIYLFLEKYNNQHNEELTLFLEKENERINATSIVKNKYVEDGTDAFYFVDAFQEVMFDAYFLKE